MHSNSNVHLFKFSWITKAVAKSQLESWLCCFLAVWPWKYCSTLTNFLLKMRILFRGLNKLTGKHLEQDLAHSQSSASISLFLLSSQSPSLPQFLVRWLRKVQEPMALMAAEMTQVWELCPTEVAILNEWSNSFFCKVWMCKTWSKSAVYCLGRIQRWKGQNQPNA